VTALQSEISTLQSEIVLFHQHSSLRSEHYSSSHLQPAVQIAIGKSKLIFLDSLWTECITRTGFAVYGLIRKKEIEINFSEEVTHSLTYSLTDSLMLLLLPLSVSISVSSLSVSLSVSLCLSPSLYPSSGIL
jgi:hypothetical protein